MALPWHESGDDLKCRLLDSLRVPLPAGIPGATAAPKYGLVDLLQDFLLLLRGDVVPVVKGAEVQVGMCMFAELCFSRSKPSPRVFVSGARERCKLGVNATTAVQMNATASAFAHP